MCPGSARDDCPASKAAREARVARTDAESLRLLYVALTRARDRLVVMGRALKRPEEGFEAGSWWSVIAETFQRLGDDEPLNARDIGDGVLRFGVDPDTLSAGVVARPATATVPSWARAAPAPDRAARFASPSKMEETTRIPAPSPLATTAGPGAPLGRFRRGDLIHRLLERLPDIAPSDRADAAARIMSRERDLDDSARAEMIEAAFGVLDDARFAPVFGPGSRPEVALTGAVGDVPISGRMDRLVITPDRVLVVDYKTNRPAPDRIEDADPAYVLQMAVYASVLARLYPDRAVEAALVWTDGPRLMAVPAEMMRAALTG
jgi:ATP-dependent helicase/nuclease subunit A